MTDRHVVPLMDEGEPITLADGRPGRVRRCGHCGGSLSVPDAAAEVSGLQELNRKQALMMGEETKELLHLRAEAEQLRADYDEKQRELASWQSHDIEKQREIERLRAEAVTAQDERTKLAEQVRQYAAEIEWLRQQYVELVNDRDEWREVAETPDDQLDKGGNADPTGKSWSADFGKDKP